jgi:ADP-heptose:LPS heptosyltransferase
MFPLIIVRMSAIGDTILASRTQLQARNRGYTPFLLTSSSNKSLVQCMPQLGGAVLLSEKGFSFLARISDASALKEVDEATFLKKLNPAREAGTAASQIGPRSLPIADLQATRRSRRALAELEKLFKSQHIRTSKYVVRKLSLWRIFLVLWSFFARSQWSGRKPPQWLQKKLKPVRELQKELIEKIPQLKNNICLPENRNLLSPVQSLLPNGVENSQQGNHIVLLLGSSFRLKSWPREHFRKLIDLVLDRTNLNVVLCGGCEDQTVGEYLRFQNPDRITDLTGRTTLQETLSWINSSVYVVTGDSFASHAADLMGIPASVLFGATHPLLGFRPESPHTIVHHTELSCSPCSRHGQGDCRFKNIRCLTSIKPEDVFSKIEQILIQRCQKPNANPPLI